MDAEMFARMSSNHFLSALGNPTAVEAKIGRVYQRDGLEAACAHIESEHGHDSFLLPIERYLRTFGAYMDRLYDEIHHAS